MRVKPISGQKCVRIEHHFDGGSILVATGELAEKMYTYQRDAVVAAVEAGVQAPQDLGAWERFERVQSQRVGPEE